jgi:hypothetical protein
MARIGNIDYHARAIRHSDSLEKLMRVGFVCKGIVYVLIGILALLVALGEGGETTGSKGAVARIASQPFGEFALAVIGVGLLAYALWRFICAFRDSEHEGSDAKGMSKRAGYVFSGAVYTSTAFYALQLLAGNGGSGGDQTQTWTARLMDAPAGVFLVFAAGVATVVGGLYQIHKGWREKFRQHLRSLPAGRNWVIRAGKWGYIARGIVFAIIGMFIMIAAVQHDPAQARGLEGALDTLAQQPLGTWLLGFVAAGLACYGAYSIIEGRYRKLNL